MSNQAKSQPAFGGRLRVRVVGILQKDNKILLLKHEPLGPAKYLWLPPGGGVEFGQSLEETLKKEFLEETNLKIDVGNYLFTNEFIDKNHHAIELFFRVYLVSGELKLGSDPELITEDQILKEARFFNYQELNEIPENAIHNAFITAKTRDKIADLRGLITFKYL